MFFGLWLIHIYIYIVCKTWARQIIIWFCEIIQIKNTDPRFIRTDTSFIFTSSIRHILSSENSNSTILFCIFIRFSQHFTGFIARCLELVLPAHYPADHLYLHHPDGHRWCRAGCLCKWYQIRNATHSALAPAPSSALRSPRGHCTTVLLCTVYTPATVHCTGCSPQTLGCLPGILSEPRLSFILPRLPINQGAGPIQTPQYTESWAQGTSMKAFLSHVVIW